MQKVVGVNLNGNAYQVEEAGFTTLSAYLDRAATRLANNPDRAEILTDLEQAIADKCTARLGANKTVVTAAEIDQILAEMGPVDAGDATTGDARQEAGGPGAPKPPKAAPAESKRLYQIREGAMISGVCNGIAAYLDVDVTIVRIVFVLLGVLTKGAFLALYAVLMFVIPHADTPEEQAAARGRRFTAQDVVDQAKRNYEYFRTNKDWKRHWRQQQRAWRRQWRYTFHSNYWGGPTMINPNIASPTAPGFAAPFFGLIHAALVLGLVLAVMSLVTRHALFGIALPPGVPDWAWFLVFIFVYQVLASPLIAARHVPIGYGYSPFMWLQPVFNLLWLGFIAFGIWWGYHNVPAVHDFIVQLPTMWHQFVADLRKS